MFPALFCLTANGFIGSKAENKREEIEKTA